MERDAIVGHGISMFVRESIMKRGDGETFLICNGCGTIPIYNESEKFYVCPLCDGPLEFSGKTVNNLELIPPIKRSLATFSKIEMPYVVKLLDQELSTYMNIGMRFLTAKNLTRLPKPSIPAESDTLLAEFKDMPLPDLVQEDLSVPPERRKVEEEEKDEDDLANMPGDSRAQGGNEEADAPLAENEDEALEVAMEEAARNAAAAVAASRGASAAVAAEATARAFSAAVSQPRPPATVMVGAPRLNTVPETNESNLASAASAALPAAPNPLAQGAYSEAPSQIQIIQNVPLLPAGTTVLGAAGPGGRPTLIVDTSSAAMSSQGLPALALPGAAAPPNLSNRGSLANRSGTRRIARNAPNRPSIFGQANAAPSGPPSSSARVTVQKLG
jgi:hypothetical protein